MSSLVACHVIFDGIATADVLVCDSIGSHISVEMSLLNMRLCIHIMEIFRL